MPDTTPLPPPTDLPTDPDVPPLYFSVPDGFFALPVAASSQERASRAELFVRELYTRGSPELWEPAAPYYEGLARFLASDGVSYAALGLFAIGPEDEQPGPGGPDGRRVAQCALTVAAVRTDHEDPEIAAQGIRAALARDPGHDARLLELPCGPAASCVTLREMVIGPESSASGAQERLATGQIQVHIPFPTGPYTAVFTLHTAATEYWGEFSDMFAAVLRGVEFTRAAPEAS
ncbi:hypothetical protein [Streptomyces sp. NPDC007088]|uniref:hypothetical protein n=1 Tax=Streptomyces sp. NPDC007088 TaxID=3364773 RepID=UPI003683AA96